MTGHTLAARARGTSARTGGDSLAASRPLPRGMKKPGGFLSRYPPGEMNALESREREISTLSLYCHAPRHGIIADSIGDHWPFSPRVFSQRAAK